MTHRYPRVLRLRKKLDFVRVQSGGRRIRSAHLTACWSMSTSGPRFGLTVSRKVGNAVTRNRVKRWLREGIRRNRSESLAVDLVLIASPQAANAGFHVLQGEVVSLLHRVLRSAAR